MPFTQFLGQRPLRRVFAVAEMTDLVLVRGGGAAVWIDTSRVRRVYDEARDEAHDDDPPHFDRRVWQPRVYSWSLNSRRTRSAVDFSRVDLKTGTGSD